MVHVSKNIGNKGDISRSLKYCDFRPSKHPEKDKNKNQDIAYLAENKFNSIKKDPQYYKVLKWSKLTLFFLEKYKQHATEQ